MDLRRLGSAVLPVAAAAGLGGLGSRRAPDIYQRLGKPAWAPPASAFGPVWSALYVAIAAAGWRLSVTGSGSTRALHLTQLTLNGAWPATFFEIRDKRASLVIIALLDISLGLEIARLRREDRRAAALLLPYLAWTAFATALNAAVTNPEPTSQFVPVSGCRRPLHRRPGFAYRDAGGDRRGDAFAVGPALAPGVERERAGGAPDRCPAVIRPRRSHPAATCRPTV